MNVVELPSNGSPGLAKEVACRKEANADAFLELEPPICDAAHMAKLIEGLIIEAHQEGQLDEHTAWAVMHLCEMVKGVRNQLFAKDDAN
jgi:hypothetical protein